MSESVSSKNKETSMVTDLTTGSVPKLLFAFAAPLFISNALQAIYNIVDMIVVGQVIGGTGMSAVSTGGNILSILNFVVMGFSSAGQIIISRDVGDHNMAGVRKTIGTMFTILMSMSVIIGVLCFFLRHPILRLVNTPEEAYTYTLQYMIVCICGLPFIYGYNIVSAIMRGMGDSKRPFIFVAIASVINIILDILFTAILGMEVFGAALATVIGQGFSFLYSLYYLYVHREGFGFDFKPASFIPDMEMTKRLVALGIPMALQSAAISISMTVVTAWVNAFGVVASACSGILNKLNNLVGILSHSITTAAGSMVSQNLGAKKYDRVPKTLFWAVLGAAVFNTIYVIIILLYPGAIFGLFTSDTEIITNAAIIVLPSIIGAYGAVSRCFAFGIINGSGNSILNLLVAIIDGVIGRIGLAYLLGWGFSLGPLGFWLGDAIAGFVPMLIGGVYYLTGKWKAEAAN